MKFTMLITTLGERSVEIDKLFESLEYQTYKNFEVIVVSQDNHKTIENLLNKYSFEFKHITINQRGLSNARNIGLDYVTGDILNFTDDDSWLHTKSLEIVKEYIEKYKPDVATFQSFDPIKKQYLKNYPKNNILGFSKLNILKQSSSDIFINISQVKDFKIGFDTRFGLGAKYNSGEENIYLMDIYNRGYKKMYYFPEKIVFHPLKPHKLNNEGFIAKGPLFKRLFGNITGLFLFIVFAFKKMNLIDNFFYTFKLSIKEFIKFKV